MLPYNADIRIEPNFRSASDTFVNSATDTTFCAQYYFESFKISTPDGKDYYFGEGGAKIATPFYGKSRMYQAWNLTRIVDRLAMDTVYFSYGAAGQVSGNIPAGYERGKAFRALKSKQWFINSFNTTDGCMGATASASEYQPSLSSRLSKITSSKEELTFTGTSLLTVTDRVSGVAYKKFIFDYNKFIDGRWKLVGLTGQDLITGQYSPYTFSYYDTLGYGGPSAQDYWGFHNGKANNNMLYTGYPGCTAAAADRKSAWPAMKLDALTEIAYPTGGKTVFEYEPHTASKGRTPNGSIQSDDAFYVSLMDFSIYDLIGGLRVKKVLQIDPVKKDTLQKSFYYNTFGSTMSSGYLHIPPVYTVDISSFPCKVSNTTDQPKYQLATSNLYPGSESGPHVSYNNVTVKEERNGKTNGRTEYEFYDDSNTDSSFYSNSITNTTRYPLSNTTDIFPSWQYKRLPENFLDGSEKEQRVYDSAGTLLNRHKSLYKSVVYTPRTTGIVMNTALNKDLCGYNLPPPSNGSGSGWAELGYLKTGIPERHLIKTVVINDDSTLSEANIDVLTQSMQTEQYCNAFTSGTGVRPILPPPHSYYFFYSYSLTKMAVLKSQDIVENYPSPGNYSTDTTTYLYENSGHLNPTSITSRTSKGAVSRQQNLYAFDFNDVNSGDSTIFFMRKANLNLPLASFSYVGTNVVAGGYKKYILKSRIDSTTALPTSNFTLIGNASGTAPATLNIGATFPMSLNFPAANFQNTSTLKYNANNTISYIIGKTNERTSLLWDYNKNFVIAQAVNADSANIAYSSFETSYNGNWVVSGAARNTASSVTGKKSYSLSNGNVSKSGLASTLIYKVSYWSNSTAATVNSAPGVAGPTKNGWTYYVHTLPASSTSVAVSGSVTIDELRLYPDNSLMTSYTFEPSFGVTTANTAANSITYYEYDGMGGLKNVRDGDKNILKTVKSLEIGFAQNTSVWRSSGNNWRYKPCAANTSYLSVIRQIEQIDINQNSSTYNTLRWFDMDTCKNCDFSDWQNTATAIRCQKTAANENTGQQEREQKDMNPCYQTYNTTKWIVTGTNTTACPLPPPPAGTCTGDDKMIINNVCVTGTKIYTASVYSQSMGQWSCKYHYEWPGCVKSIDYYEYKATACVTNSGCVPD